MQIRITAILILGFTTICSSPKNADTKTQSTTELLVQKSPWTFDTYKVLKILDKGNTDVNDAMLKFWVYNNSDSVNITFNDNHSGAYFDSKRNQEVTFNWTLTENDIEIKLDSPISGTIYYKNVEISSIQFKFEKEDLGFDKEKKEVIFYGTYVYN